MKSFFLLLIAVGISVVMWLNWDKVRDLQAQAATIDDSAPATAARPPGAASPTPIPTPHPAREARAAAAAAYPALRLPDSALHKRFISLYEEAQFRDPALLADPKWPLKLAERAAVSLGGGAMPTPTPRPTGPPPASPDAKPQPSRLQGSALDMRPGGKPAR